MAIKDYHLQEAIDFLNSSFIEMTTYIQGSSNGEIKSEFLRETPSMGEYGLMKLSEGLKDSDQVKVDMFVQDEGHG